MACPLAGYAVLQEMSRDDLQTQRQMMHLDVEIKELTAWADDMAKMAAIFIAARKIFGDLEPPRTDELGPEWANSPQLPDSASALDRTLCECHTLPQHMLIGSDVPVRSRTAAKSTTCTCDDLRYALMSFKSQG